MNRIYHTWDEWECYPAGFYQNTAPRSMKAKDAIILYAAFLRDLPAFEEALRKVISEWKNSCEHYLSNQNMNRIAWLGQASACVALGLPAAFRSGYHLLSEAEKSAADEMALKYLNVWLVEHGEEPLTLEAAGAKTEMDLY